MPFYEYECSNCKFYVEALQKISDQPLKQCPSCKKQTLKKLVSAPVFRLKGGGWYETDFKSDKEEKRNLAEREETAGGKAEEAKPDAGKAEAKEDKKAEARTDAKPTAKPPVKPVVKPTAQTRPAPRGAAKPRAAAKPKAKAKPAPRKKRR